MNYLYSYGLPFSEKLGENLYQQLKRINQKRASLIIIDGGLGVGKTTLAIELMDEINKKYKFPNVSLKIKEHPQMSLGGKEFTGCFRECIHLKLKAITYDEAGDFSRKGAITRFNMMINRLFEVYRGFKMLIIICLPNVNILDNQLFDNQIPRMLVHITDRTNKQGNFKAYSLSQLNWIRYWFDKLPKGAKQKCYNLVEPNFYGHFLNLPKPREKELDKLSTYGKKSLLKNAEIEMRDLISYYDIEKKFNRSYVWITQTLHKLKIKSKITINRKKYFDRPTIVNALSTYLDNLKHEKFYFGKEKNK